MRFIVLGFAASMTLLSATASAANPKTAECLAASESSADLRITNKLREAQEKLRICAAASCPSEIRNECVRRQTEVAAATPTVVFEAKDASGNDLVAVKVTMDGQVLATKLEGSALSVDPGDHAFTFETEGQPAVQKSFVLREGEKDRRERIVIGNLPKPAAPVTPAAIWDSNQGPPAATQHSHLLEWTLIGGGAALAAAGAVFMAVEANGTSDAANGRDRSTYDSALNGWRFALAGTIVGAVAAAAGGVLLVVSQGREATQSSRDRVWLGAGPGTLHVGGTW
jgi:hypothetical protein